MNALQKLQKVLPAKRLTFIQNTVCLVLIIAVFVMSFGAMFTAKLPQDQAEFATQLNEMMANLSDGSAETFEIPTELDLSLPFVIGSVASAGDIVKAVSDQAKNLSSQLSGDFSDGNMDAAEPPVSGEEIQKSLSGLAPLITLASLIAFAFSQSFLSGFVYVYMLILLICIPITMLVCVLRALISYLRHLSDPENAFNSIMKSMNQAIAVFPMLFVLMMLTPNIALGGAGKAMVIVLAIGVALNLIVSRLKVYNKHEFKYINVIQGASVVGLIAYFLFYKNINGANLFGAYLDKLGAYMINGIGATIQGETVSVLPLFCGIFMIVMTIFVAGYIANLLCRLACMVPGSARNAKDTYLASTIMGLFLIIVPVYLMKSDFGMTLSESEMSSFYVACAGIVLMLVTEIVLIVLKKNICADVSVEEMKGVLNGCPAGIVAENGSETSDEAVEENAEKAEDAEETEDAVPAVAEQEVEEKTDEE